MSRPAIKVKCMLPAVETRFTDEPFSLKLFIEQVWRIGGYKKSTASIGPLKIFEGCAGAGTIMHVLEAMGFKVEGAAVEREPSAALFLARNHTCSCIFVDMAEVARAVSPGSDGKACCYLHGTRCPVPPSGDGISIYSSGFACPPYSKQNPRRFHSDCIQHPHPIHNVSLEATIDQVEARQPKISILENTYGMKSARGGGNLEPAAEAITSKFQSRFAPASVAMVEGTAYPLATPRPRLFWYVSVDQSEPAATLKKEFEVLRQKILQELPMHHARVFLASASTKLGSAGSPRVEHGGADMLGSASRASMETGDAGVTGGAVVPDIASIGGKLERDRRLQPANAGVGEATTPLALACSEADYALAFAKALRKAQDAGRLSADTLVPPQSKRVSAACPALQGATAWMCAQVDVYSLISTSRNDSKSGCQYRVGDVSQSVSRGVLASGGHLPTITTSTMWFNFAENGFVKPQAMMAAHGFDLDKLEFTALTDKEVRRLAGNSMACSLVVLVLTPALRALGYLERVP